MVLESGKRFRFRAAGQDLAAWSWGDGPTVVLLHGWGGHAGQMSAFVGPLTRAGFRVVAYDGPAHGASTGRTTGLPRLAAALQEYASGNIGVHAVVAHSIGCAATMLAIREGLNVARAVLLAPPADMPVFLSTFGDCLELTDRVRQGMAARLAEEFAIDWAEMNVAHWSLRARPPLLVFHDRDDGTVPWEHGRAVCDAWQEAELVSSDGLGHRRSRHDRRVVERAVAFLAESAKDFRRGRIYPPEWEERPPRNVKSNRRIAR